jgi:2-phospho-L-lactate guanylyltransferase
VVPVKDRLSAKQRLSSALTPQQRQQLALAMLGDVLATLTAVSELAGVLVVTVDPQATLLARRYGARISTAGACDGHTGAVRAAAHALSAEGLGMLELPADIPLVTPGDISDLLGGHGDAPAFTIAPARDERGSNAILCSPADAVPLQFGDDSFRPHLAAAQARGIAPVIIRNPRIGLDLDGPDDLALFQKTPSSTCAYALLQSWRDAEHDALQAIPRLAG